MNAVRLGGFHYVTLQLTDSCAFRGNSSRNIAVRGDSRGAPLGRLMLAVDG